MGTIRNGSSIRPLRIVTTENGEWVFLQTSLQQVEVYKQRSGEWEAAEQVVLPAGESISHIGTQKNMLICGTSKTRLLFFDADQKVCVSKPFTLGGNLWTSRPSPVHSAAFYGDEICIASMGNNTVVVCSLSRGNIRKLLTARCDIIEPVRNLHCSEYCCFGSVKNWAFVWDIFGSKSSPRNILVHSSIVRGLHECFQRLVTTCADGTVSVWSTLTGKRMRNFVPLKDVNHPLRSSFMTDSETLIITAITGIYKVKFKPVTWKSDEPMYYLCKS